MLRDFTYIDDIVEGLIWVIKIPAKSDLGWMGKYPNLGSSKAPYKIYSIEKNSPVNLIDFEGNRE